MPGALWIAAGGGGDALAAAVLHQHLSPGTTPVIATFAWDRLLIDPIPGPRTPDDFEGLDWLDDVNAVVTGRSRPRPPAGSTLPRLAREVPATLVLLDPRPGAEGLHAQIGLLVAAVDSDTIELLDVGGDVLADGSEAELRSPLADALSLAAVANQPVPSRVLITGLGLDGELSEDYARGRLERLNGGVVASFDEEDANRFARVLDWHPSEATALTLAAARGDRGTVEIRGAGHVVELTDRSAEVYAVRADQLVAESSIARGVAGSVSLEEAESGIREVCGRSELDHERRKAAEMEGRSNERPGVPDVARVLASYAPQACARGVDYLTARRIAELTGTPAQALPLVREYLARSEPGRYRVPLWRTCISSNEHS